MEQVSLHDTAPFHGRAVAERHQVGFGQPIGLTPHTLPIVAPRPRNHTFRTACRWRHARTTVPRRFRRRRPTPRCATRTNSTAGARSPRSGRPPATSRSRRSARDRARDEQDQTARQAATRSRTCGEATCEREQHAERRSRTSHDHRDEAARLHDRARRSSAARGGWKVREASAAVGRARSGPADCPATTNRPWPWTAWPRAPRRDRSWARADPDRSSRSCRGSARLPILAFATCIQPPPSS